MEEDLRQETLNKINQLREEINNNKWNKKLGEIQEALQQNHLSLKSIAELKDRKFIIPSYQRGYRWEEKQVKELMEDLATFWEENANDDDLSYCLQPIIVKRKEGSEEIEIIDGQQRLTTLNFILKYIYDEKPYYTLSYETKGEKNEETIQTESKKTIDCIYRKNAEDIILKNIKKYKDNIESLIQSNRLKFLWYEVEENTSPNEIFSRVNNGKIPLTNAELCKALLLTVNKEETGKERFEQLKKALKWDEIENNLEENELWYFLMNTDREFKSNRMDLLFKIYRYVKTKEGNQNKKKLDEFRFIEDRLKNTSDVINLKEEIWRDLIKIYDIMKEWYEDQEIFHYLGYWICQHEQDTVNELGKKIYEYGFNTDKTNKKNQNKEGFIVELKKEILEDLKKTYDEYTKDNKYEETKDILLTNIRYCSEKKINKNSILIRKILLLFNVCTLVDKETRLSFYKYKSEDYDIEHIYPSHELEDINASTEKLRGWNEFCNKLSNKELDQEINNIDELEKIIVKQLKTSKLDDEYKDGLGNLALLNSSINRSFKNDWFIQKRQRIIESIINKKGKEKLKDEKFQKETYYILPCTERVFLKFYTGETLATDKWEEIDCDNYMNEIARQLNNSLSMNKEEIKIIGKEEKNGC